MDTNQHHIISEGKIHNVIFKTWKYSLVNAGDSKNV